MSGNSPPGPIAVSNETHEILSTSQPTKSTDKAGFNPDGHLQTSPKNKPRQRALKSLSVRAREAEAARRYRMRKNQDSDALQNQLKSAEARATAAEARAAAAEARAAAAEKKIIDLHGEAQGLVFKLQSALDGIQAVDGALSIRDSDCFDGIQAADEGDDVAILEKAMSNNYMALDTATLAMIEGDTGMPTLAMIEGDIGMPTLSGLF